MILTQERLVFTIQIRHQFQYNKYFFKRPVSLDVIVMVRVENSFTDAKHADAVYLVSALICYPLPLTRKFWQVRDNFPENIFSYSTFRKVSRIKTEYYLNSVQGHDCLSPPTSHIRLGTLIIAAFILRQMCGDFISLFSYWSFCLLPSLNCNC